MYPIKKIIRALVDNYIFIGICAVYFYLSGFVLMPEADAPDLWHISLVFWATVTVYYLIANNKIHHIYLKGAKAAFDTKAYISLVLTGITSLLFFFIPVTEALYLGHLGVISMLYNIPKTVNVKSLPLRGVPLLKIFLIAYVWASIGAVFPALQNEQEFFGPRLLRLFAADFVFILAIAMPFDIRDYYSEDIDEPHTLARLLGLRHTVTIALFFLGIFTALLWPLLNKPLLFSPFILLTSLLIFYSTPHKNKYYYTVLLDGTLILYYFALRLATT